MDKVTTRRLFLGGAVIALAISPFIIRNLRKTTELPQTGTFEVKVDPSVVPSGKIKVFWDFITFQPLTLPGGEIRSGTLNASLSNDNKWLFVSYSFSEDHQSQICYAPLDKSGLPETFVELDNFGSQSFVLGMGCSSFNSGSSRFSYRWRKYEKDTGINKGSLFCVSLRQQGQKLEYVPDSTLLLSKDECPAESVYLPGAVIANHCWLEGKNAFVSQNLTGMSLLRANCESVVSGERISFLRQLFKGVNNNIPEGRRVIPSNLFLEEGTIKFFESPVSIRPDKWDRDLDPYRTEPGLLVSLDSEGAIKSEEVFPVPSCLRKTLLTRTHYLFHGSLSPQFFFTAALETPQEYSMLRFSQDDLEDSGIAYIFDILAILPSGRHLLCARDVGRSYVDKAKELGLPLSTLGIIELPFNVG